MLPSQTSCVLLRKRHLPDQGRLQPSLAQPLQMLTATSCYVAVSGQLAVAEKGKTVHAALSMRAHMKTDRTQLSPQQCYQST